MKNPRLTSAVVVALILVAYGFYRAINRRAAVQSDIELSTANIGALPSVREKTPTLKKTQRLSGTQNGPIDFYGQVVDQDNKPLKGVSVNLSLRQWFPLAGVFNLDARFVHFHCETDSNGRFEIVGARGDCVEWQSIEKEGYRISSQAQKDFLYNGPAFFVPDPKNPVVFKMWRVGPKQELLLFHKVVTTSFDRTPQAYNLVEAKKVPNGAPGADIEVRFERPPGANYQNPYRWTVSIRVLNGGLAETNDEFMFLAPENGYIEKFEIEFNPGTKDWVSVAKRQFFIKLRDGRIFGRIRAEFLPDYGDKSAIDLDYALNPSGSRSLE